MMTWYMTCYCVQMWFGHEDRCI